MTQFTDKAAYQFDEELGPLSAGINLWPPGRLTTTSQPCSNATECLTPYRPVSPVAEPVPARVQELPEIRIVAAPPPAAAPIIPDTTLYIIIAVVVIAVIAIVAIALKKRNQQNKPQLPLYYSVCNISAVLFCAFTNYDYFL